MNKFLAQIAILLILASAGATLASQENIQTQGDEVNAELAWAALKSSMGKMHSAMSSLESSGNSDADFVRLMLPHHQAAIDMAKTQLLYGKDPQMRRLAQEIITDQQSEIELMQLWLKQRGPESQKADQVSHSGMKRER